MKLTLFGREIVNTDGSKVPRSLSRRDSTQAIHISNLQPKVMRQIVCSEPMINKAIWKKNKDTYKNWFELRDMYGGELLSDQRLRILKKFENRVDLRGKMLEASVCANIYGSGFIEKIYKDDSGTCDTEVSDGLFLKNIRVLNPEHIVKYGVRPDSNDGQKYFHYKSGVAEVSYFHPSRIEVVVFDRLPAQMFGVSKVNLLHNILKSKMNFDISSGEYLNWGGLGMFDVTIKNMQDEQEDAAIAKLQEHPDFLVHDEDYELKVENPKSLDPKEFADYFFTNIAAALEMPRSMLTGSDMGNVTGSEVGMSAYLSDVANNQRIVSPILLNIYNEYFYGYSDFPTNPLNVELKWNEIFVDELSEAKILQTRTYSAVQCVNAKIPIISVEEARRIISDGETNLIPEDVPDLPENEPRNVSDPNIEPQPVKKEEQIEWEELSDEQLRMIEIERELGRRELIEQEKRVKGGQLEIQDYVSCES